MRRKEKAITDSDELGAIMQKADVCRLGLAVDNTPYVVPVNYGYDTETNCIFIHCAKEGRKLDMIRQNNTVCFEMDVDMEIADRGKTACNWSTSYRSVIGYGTASMVEDFEQKKNALDIIMNHYSSNESFEYKKKSIEGVGIIKIAVTHLSGKKSV
ncbi:MAG: pyridoxamine 5'-phosphate oxidase family protein [bacterium]|nr:pyridoxamine 5'-phosphate oxidase family protein [bacterium]